MSPALGTPAPHCGFAIIAGGLMSLIHAFRGGGGSRSSVIKGRLIVDRVEHL